MIERIPFARLLFEWRGESALRRGPLSILIVRGIEKKRACAAAAPSRHAIDRRFLLLLSGRFHDVLKILSINEKKGLTPIGAECIHANSFWQKGLTERKPGGKDLDKRPLFGLKVKARLNGSFTKE
ncbi:MAG: hypothetical protein JW884_05755 [Deltaproteobacteria bacterium]|nr:hypothetical protein [Deltaproteobacteria bacterium]